MLEAEPKSTESAIEADAAAENASSDDTEPLASTSAWTEFATAVMSVQTSSLHPNKVSHGNSMPGKPLLLKFVFFWQPAALSDHICLFLTLLVNELLEREHAAC